MTHSSRRRSLFAIAVLLVFMFGSPAFAQEPDPPGQEEAPPEDPPGQEQTPPGQEGRDDDGPTTTTDDGGAGAEPGGDPQGVAARGTVKIEETPIEANTANEAHAGCAFGLSFFGFREQTAPVVFTLQPPSGTDELGTRQVALSEARGNELSGILEVDLTNELAAYAPVQASAYDYKIRVDVVIAERGESGTISKSAIAFLDCPEAAAAALAAGLERLPVAGAVAGPAVRVAPAGASVPAGGIAAGAGGTSGSGSPVAPVALVLLVAISGVLCLRRGSMA